MMNVYDERNCMSKLNYEIKCMFIVNLLSV